MQRMLIVSALVLWAQSAQAVTITNTVSWTTEPANVQTYLVEKGVSQTGPWTTLPSVLAGTKQFIDANNLPGINACYRVTPTNSLPSTGAPAIQCSMLIGPVGNMGVITISPLVVP